MFKQALNITNNSILLAIPLIFFIKITDIYSNFALYQANTAPKFLLASFTVVFMVGVFAAAFFYMVKESIEISKKEFIMDSDRTSEIVGIFKNVTDGIGKYFLSFAGAYIIMFLIEIALLPIVYFVGVKFIGHLNPALVQGIQEVAKNSSAVSAFVDKLTVPDLLFFAKWSLLIMAVVSVVLYLLMLWVPEIIYNTRNPFVALYKSVIKLFKNFLDSLKLYVSLYLICFIIFILFALSDSNIVLYFVANFVLYYFYLYMTILVFLYYDSKFNKKSNEDE